MKKNVYVVIKKKKKKPTRIAVLEDLGPESWRPHPTSLGDIGSVDFFLQHSIRMP